MDEDMIALLEDASSSEAYKLLNDLLAAGDIPVHKADKAKAQYATLHGELVRALANERDLLDKARALKKQKEDQQAAMAGPAADGEDDIDSLREDVEGALGEAALAQERQQLLQLEVTDLQRQRNELGARMEELATEHAAALQPVIASIRTELLSLGLESEEERRRLEGARDELDVARSKLGILQAETATLSEAKAVERGHLAKVEPLPDKARRQSEAVAAILKSVQSQMDSMNARFSEDDQKCKAAAARERELQEEHARLLVALDRGRAQVESKGRHADDIRKDVELASIEADKILADQVELDLRIKNVIAELKMEGDMLSRRQREKELMLRQYRIADQQVKDAREALPNLKFQVEQMHRDVSVLEARRRGQGQEVGEVKRDLDIQMATFLHTEADGKDKVSLFQTTFKEVAGLEQELCGLKREEAERSMILRDLSSQRDRIALSIAQKLSRVKDQQMTNRIKQVELAELKKIRKEVSRQIRDFEKYYDITKHQRNKFVNLIQASNQSMTEMKDKLKILQNELDILQNEVGIKDKLLQQQHTQHQANIADRDQLRVELGRLGMVFRDKQAVVDEQIAEVDKLNAIINGCEKEMMRLKRQYEVAIESRNYTGIMLIDRNDELCVLYEKNNIQEEVLRTGQLELVRRTDEARLLKLEVAELQRSIEVTKHLVPHVPLLDTDVARLQKQLFEARREAEQLSLSLEDPSNTTRWRLLEGKIPDREELAAKIQALEERLNDKKEQLLEKELILEEVTSLSDKLRLQAAEGRADTLELAQRVNEYQSKLRAVTRKIMATVSELSMYQASALKLGAEREELDLEVCQATERLGAGQPPTEDAEREWYRMERERLTVGALAEERRMAEAAQDARASEVTSAADPRPNAYIPEQLGIPKPYGAFAPFKPQDSGATMRHIRKPQPKEVVI